MNQPRLTLNRVHLYQVRLPGQIRSFTFSVCSPDCSMQVRELWCIWLIMSDLSDIREFSATIFRLPWKWSIQNIQIAAFFPVAKTLDWERQFPQLQWHYFHKQEYLSLIASGNDMIFIYKEQNTQLCRRKKYHQKEQWICSNTNSFSKFIKHTGSPRSSTLPTARLGVLLESALLKAAVAICIQSCAKQLWSN